MYNFIIIQWASFDFLKFHLCLFSVLPQNAQVSMNKLRDFQKAMEMLVPQGPAKNIDEAKKKHYQFWDTQPVPKLGECKFCVG